MDPSVGGAPGRSPVDAGGRAFRGPGLTPYGRASRRGRPGHEGTVHVRVLFSSTWGHGHVFPMVPLARALVDAGHQVLWATNEPAVRLVVSAGLPAVATGLDAAGVVGIEARLAAEVADVPPSERAAHAFPSMFGAWATPAMVADLLPVARDFAPDLMVHEQGELGSALVAAVLGVPSVTHAFGGAVPAGFVAAAGERLADLWAAHERPLPPYAGSYLTAYVDICPPSVQTQSLDHVPVRLPLRPVAHATTPTEVLREPPGDAPLVYVTLGTVRAHTAALADAVAGLADLDVRVVVAVGPAGDPAALGAQPPNVTVAGWVDQAALLPRCSVVVSHTGSGTFLGALASGVPQLSLPQAADQFRNATALARGGLGLVLVPGEATAANVADAVRQLIADDRYRAAAAGVAAEIAAMPAPEQVVPQLELLA